MHREPDLPWPALPIRLVLSRQPTVPDDMIRRSEQSGTASLAPETTSSQPFVDLPTCASRDKKGGGVSGNRHRGWCSRMLMVPGARPTITTTTITAKKKGEKDLISHYRSHSRSTRFTPAMSGA